MVYYVEGSLKLLKNILTCSSGFSFLKRLRSKRKRRMRARPEKRRSEEEERKELRELCWHLGTSVPKAGEWVLVSGSLDTDQTNWARKRALRCSKGGWSCKPEPEGWRDWGLLPISAFAQGHGLGSRAVQSLQIKPGIWGRGGGGRAGGENLTIEFAVSLARGMAQLHSGNGSEIKNMSRK